MSGRLLLLSNSLNPGGRYLAHARAAMRATIGTGARHALFVPYAGVRIPWDVYHRRVAEAVAPAGITLHAIHRSRDPVRALREAGAVLVGGGNTFHLLDHLQRLGLVPTLRARVAQGMPYVGWSAGSNVACPTIRTTNDMPIVAPRSLAALGLVPFQVNPHYTEARLRRHGGETRVDRLREFCAANPRMPVVALREGSWLEVSDGEARLGGPRSALIYLGETRRVLRPGAVVASHAAATDETPPRSRRRVQS
ncbi:MAG: dipeptidase PepE [Gemmatimonadales bacterium]|jgi:dipeptidase E|nr:dipeptidase PepE [Gemmatimonadales bacterium]